MDLDASGRLLATSKAAALLQGGPARNQALPTVPMRLRGCTAVPSVAGGGRCLYVRLLLLLQLLLALPPLHPTSLW